MHVISQCQKRRSVKLDWLVSNVLSNRIWAASVLCVRCPCLRAKNRVSNNRNKNNDNTMKRRKKKTHTHRKYIILERHFRRLSLFSLARCTLNNWKREQIVLYYKWFINKEKKVTELQQHMSNDTCTHPARRIVFGCVDVRGRQNGSILHSYLGIRIELKAALSFGIKKKKWARIWRWWQLTTASTHMIIHCCNEIRNIFLYSRCSSLPSAEHNCSLLIEQNAKEANKTENDYWIYNYMHSHSVYILAIRSLPVSSRCLPTPVVTVFVCVRRSCRGRETARKRRQAYPIYSGTRLICRHKWTCFFYSKTHFQDSVAVKCVCTLMMGIEVPRQRRHFPTNTRN